VSIVYIVSRGKECIAIEGIFSNKEKAQEYIDYFKGTTTYNDINEEIAEYELDNTPDYIKRKEYSWYIQTDAKGEIKKLEKQEFHNLSLDSFLSMSLTIPRNTIWPATFTQNTETKRLQY